MSENFLKLNEDKTEVLVVHRRAESPIQMIYIANNDITVSHAVRNLGVLFDENLMFEQHIQNVCRKVFAEIRNIGKIRKYLDEKTTATLVCAYVTSKLTWRM